VYIIVYNTALNRSDNPPCYHPDSHHSSTGGERDDRTSRMISMQGWVAERNEEYTGSHVNATLR